MLNNVLPIFAHQQQPTINTKQTNQWIYFQKKEPLLLGFRFTVEEICHDHHLSRIMVSSISRHVFMVWLRGSIFGRHWFHLRSQSSKYNITLSPTLSCLSQKDSKKYIFTDGGRRKRKGLAKTRTRSDSIDQNPFFMTMLDIKILAHLWSPSN